MVNKQTRTYKSTEASNGVVEKIFGLLLKYSIYPTLSHSTTPPSASRYGFLSQNEVTCFNSINSRGRLYFVVVLVAVHSFTFVLCSCARSVERRNESSGCYEHFPRDALSPSSPPSLLLIYCLPRTIEQHKIRHWDKCYEYQGINSVSPEKQELSKTLVVVSDPPLIRAFQESNYCHQSILLYQK